MGPPARHSSRPVDPRRFGHSRIGDDDGVRGGPGAFFNPLPPRGPRQSWARTGPILGSAAPSPDVQFAPGAVCANRGMGFGTPAWCRRVPDRPGCSLFAGSCGRSTRQTARAAIRRARGWSPAPPGAAPSTLRSSFGPETRLGAHSAWPGLGGVGGEHRPARGPRSKRPPRQLAPARSGAWCSASIWSAPDGTGLLTLDASSVQTAPDGCRRTVWMIKR
jgi:hypothetical protein